MAVFWNISPCNLLDTNGRFRGSYFLHHQIKAKMDAESSSEILVNIQQETWSNIKEGNIFIHTALTNSVTQEPEGSSPHSQQPATCLHPETVESNPNPSSQPP
jgi:hypothetical protein